MHAVLEPANTEPEKEPAPVPEEEREPSPAEEEKDDMRRAEETSGQSYLAGVAEDMIKQAASEAAAKLRAAEVEAGEIKARAKSEGYEEGMRSAQQFFEDERGKDAEAVRKAIAGVQERWGELFDHYEDDIIALAFAMVKKVVKVMSEKDDKIFESMIKNALREMKREGRIIIHVSSEEYERFFSAGNGIFEIGDETVQVTVIEDHDLPPLGCVIESETENVNAGLDTQMKYISLAIGLANEANYDE